jgi:CheY-like chemotaxis protein
VACGVLIIEDDAGLREMMSQLLFLEGFQTDTAENGRVALDLLHAGLRPHVILLDLMMPVMDGWSFRKHQINDPTLAHIPVVVLSAAHDFGAIQASSILHKPLDVDRVLIALKVHCDRDPFGLGSPRT